MMENNKQLIWIYIGVVLAALAALLAAIATQAILWGPALIEIASVTWNDGPRV
ncbi:hypothetical protein ACFLXI_05240 [Chloroflexota bacterium]